MNKTVIASISIVTIGISFMFFNYNTKEITLKTTSVSQSRPMDRFTTCLDTVMTKSIEANKPISAEDAKNICLNVEKI